MHVPVVVALAMLAACSGKKDPEPQAQPAELGQLVRSDAGVTAVVTADDSTERYLDEYGAGRAAHAANQAARHARPIDITLRSSPPGAQVAVDGTVLGNTPSYWSGMADGKEHEFVFTMQGHAIARYRFVPVSSGVIHGRLDRIHEERDASVPAPPPEVVPPQPPTSPSANPPTAPPTLLPPSAIDSDPAPDSGVPRPPGAVAPPYPVGPQP